MYFFIFDSYKPLMCLLLAAPTSTHGVFTSFSLSQCRCLHFWRNKFGSMLAEGYFKGQRSITITKCYFLWVRAINMQSLNGHYLMRPQVHMVFLLQYFFSQNKMRGEVKTWWLVSEPDVASSYFWKENPRRTWITRFILLGTVTLEALF